MRSRRRLPLAVEAFLRLGELLQPAFDQRFLLGEGCRAPLEILRLFLNGLVVGAELVLGLAQLADRGIEHGAALQELLAFVFALLLFVFQLGAELHQGQVPFFNLRLGRLLADAFLVEVLFLSAHLLAHVRPCACAGRRGWLAGLPERPHAG